MTKRYSGRAAADYAGLAYTTWRSYGSTGRRPQPDGVTDGGDPYWTAATLDAYRATHPGQGARRDLAAPDAERAALITGILAWIAENNDETPRRRYTRFAEAQTGEDRGPGQDPDAFARIGLEITRWAATTQPPDILGALAGFPWLNAPWRDASQLFFEVTAAATRDAVLSAAIATKGDDED